MMNIKIGIQRKAIVKDMDYSEEDDFADEMYDYIGKELLFVYRGDDVWQSVDVCVFGSWNYLHRWLDFTSGDITPKEVLEKYCDTEILERKKEYK